MQERVIKFQINGAGTDHFKRKCIRREMALGVNVTAVKGAVFGVGDEQVIKIMNGIQSILLNVSYSCKIPHFQDKSTKSVKFYQKSQIIYQSGKQKHCLFV